MTLPTSLGRYEVLALIGHGGMGSLYRARDPRIGREVAIKLLRDGYDSEELRTRFSREAKSAGGLSHPNIVTIFDIGEYHGRPFIAMEYVPGVTLAELIRSKSDLPIGQALRFVEDVCSGLAHAHRSGVVHRDIKPANLMLGEHGTVKILDFGIAKLGASGLTQPGVLMGTPNYMAPEQVSGGVVDARSDVFATGAVLYELLSKHQAFPGEVSDGVLDRIVRAEPVPLDELAPGLDIRVVRVVNRALAKSPEQRFQTIQQMQAELAAARKSVSDGVLRASPTSPRSGGQAVLTPPQGQVPNSGSRGASDRASLARLRQQHIDAHVEAADRAFSQGSYDAAVEACEQALMLDPEEARASALIDRAHRAIDERQIQQWVVEARRHLATGALTRASELLSSAAAIRADHPDVRALREQAELARAKARAEAALVVAAKAQAAMDADDPDTAERLITEALSIDAGNVPALAVKAALQQARARQKDEQRVIDSLDQVQRRFGRGEHQAAMQMLGALPQSHRLVQAAADDLGRRLAELEAERRQDTLNAAVVRARINFDKGEWSAALREVESALRIDEHSPDALSLRDAVERAIEETRERARIADAVAEARQQLDAGAYGRAQRLLDGCRTDDPSVAAALADIERARTDAEEQLRRQAERRRERASAESLRVALMRARTALDTGDESAADAAIQDAVAHKATPADIQALRA
ncbi:MAG: protein kinase, partial [Vicinamibacterales bacterium]